MNAQVFLAFPSQLSCGTWTRSWHAINSKPFTWHLACEKGDPCNRCFLVMRGAPYFCFGNLESAQTCPLWQGAAPLNRVRHPQLFSLTNLSWRWKFEQGHVQCSIGVSISHPQICKMACVISHDSLHTPFKATHGNTFKDKPWWTVFFGFKRKDLCRDLPFLKWEISGKVKALQIRNILKLCHVWTGASSPSYESSRKPVSWKALQPLEPMCNINIFLWEESKLHSRCKISIDIFDILNLFLEELAATTPYKMHVKISYSGNSEETGLSKTAFWHGNSDPVQRWLSRGAVQSWWEKGTIKQARFGNCM